MKRIMFDQLTDLENEEFAANCVDFKLEEYKDLKNIFSYGIKELRAAINHDIVSISEASKIAELPRVTFFQKNIASDNSAYRKL